MPKKATKKKSIQKVGTHRVYFFLGVLLVLILVLGFLLVPKSHAPVALTNSQIAETINSSSVVIPDENITVKLSHGSGVVGPDDSGFVNVEEPYLSVKTPTGNDIFAVMNYNLGGSGVFATVALFEEKNGVARFKSSYPIGDRVPVTSIVGPQESSTGEYSIMVDFLDRTDQQPMSDTPTTPAQLHLQISNHEIVSK